VVRCNPPEKDLGIKRGDQHITQHNHRSWVHQWENAQGGEAGASVNRWSCPGRTEDDSLRTGGLPSPGSCSQRHQDSPLGLQPLSKLPTSPPQGQRLMRYDAALSCAGYSLSEMAGKPSSPRCPHQLLLGCSSHWHPLGKLLERKPRASVGLSPLSCCQRLMARSIASAVTNECK